MNDTLSNFMIFTAGAIIGSAVTWKLIETKYAKIAQDEIDSVKEVFSRRRNNSETSVEDISIDEKTNQLNAKEDMREYVAKLKEHQYIDYTQNTDSEEKEEEDMDDPYVISPEEFGTIDEYETISLTYYVDGVLTDDMDEPVEDVDNVVGSDSVNHFGEYEDDSVFVRNDRLKADYEILLDPREYKSVINRNPHRAED